MYPENEWRKLGKNLTRWELAKIKNIIHYNKFRFTTYSEGRSKERRISENDIRKTIRCGEIVEFHYKFGSMRVLIRGIEVIRGEAICVVLDLGTGEIITVYKNDFTDSHKTIHNEIYICKDIMDYLNVV